ncbi:YfiR family protein, partial [Acinetobacter baumannii]
RCRLIHLRIILRNKALSVGLCNKAIQNYPYRSLLSLSINNPECEVGSIFCLYNQNNYTTFKVNLDALSHSKVHIDPRVLLLAKNAE